MDDNRIAEIMENVDISIMVFPLEKDGKVEFRPLQTLSTNENTASFSAIVEIQYNLPLNCELELTLLKINDKNNEDDISSLKLADIKLRDEEEIRSRVEEIEFAQKTISIAMHSYNFRGICRYSFEQIPLIGEGIYNLAVLISDEEQIIPIKCTPINIIINKK